MSDKIKAEHLYLRFALSEALRVIAKDRGPEYVDQMSPNDIDFNGRAAVLKALGAAKEHPEPLI
jgi:hypothetical protein